MGDLIKLKGLENFVFRKYSSYEIKVFEEREYVIPCNNAEITEYDPFEVIDDLIIDFLKLGKLLYEKECDVNNTLLDFCRSYGLFGFVNSFCHNRDFTADSHVLIRQSAPTKRGKLIKTGEYLSWFFPFGVPQFIETIAADIYISDSLLFCTNYAERLSWIYSFAEFQYAHLLSLHNFKYAPGNSKNAYRAFANSFRTDNSGFSVTMTDKPELLWNIRSLQAAIETVYALEVTSEKPKLKICKTCLEPFIAKNPKAEFCSKKCGNLMHVRNFRR